MTSIVLTKSARFRVVAPLRDDCVVGGAHDRGTTVRVAGAGDVAVLAGLRRAWNEEAAGGAIEDPLFDDRFARWWTVERETRTFFIVERRATAIGMANVKRYERMPVAGRASGGRWGYVGNVFVLAEHRNIGVGEALMHFLIAWAAEEELEHLRLAPSPRSKPFYARLGYVPGAIVELDPPRQ